METGKIEFENENQTFITAQDGGKVEVVKWLNERIRQLEAEKKLQSDLIVEFEADRLTHLDFLDFLESEIEGAELPVDLSHDFIEKLRLYL